MKRLLAVPLAAGLLACVHFSQQRLDTMPEKQELAATNPFGKMPPAQYMAEYTASMLLGGMRAVAIDYLWIQYTKAEKARNYVEVNAILEILLRLQPNFAEIWQHLAWAKAYNIAAQQESEAERWLWVKSALEDSDQAVRRNPTSEKLLFHKGYMLYHRLPQEPMLLERYREWTGRDAWADAAHTLRDAILLAQSKGLNNTTPPADGMMQDAYLKLAHLLMTRGEFAKAHATLDEGRDLYRRLVPERLTTAINYRTVELCDRLHHPYALEEKLAGIERAGGDTDAVRVELLQEYVVLDKTYPQHQGVHDRIVHLTAGPVAHAFALAREGKADDAADYLGRTVLPLYSDLCVKADGTENSYWEDKVRFVQLLQAGLRLEGSSKFAEALKKYDDILDEFRYNLPVGAPQVALIKEHTAGLKGR